MPQDQDLIVVADEPGLTGLDAPEASQGSGVLLHQLFQIQAERDPEREAVVWGTERVTYAELARRAALLAETLRSLGAGPEVPVGICARRTPDLIAGMLGVLEAGAAYLPLDPGYPRERLAFMLEDSGAPVVLTDEASAASLPEAGARRVFLDREPETRERSPRRAAPPGPDNLAYLIYTSGSTGRPKGVAIPHRAAVHLMRWARDLFPAEELAGVLAATSVCFDLSVFEIFVPLSWGGRIILADNALALPGLPAAGEVTLVNTVPSAAAELVRSHGFPASVRTINLAGEALQRPLVDQLYAQTRARSVFNLYGPSEDTTYSTWARVPPGTSEAPAIGVPLPGETARVLDAELHPVRPGEEGELFLGGPALARGYLARPDLTAERFLPDPFAAAPGARLYRTGDLVREWTDGELDFLGRLDHQVKIRGFRIELGEIEAALLACPGVRESVVVAQGGPGGPRLVAYVAGADGEVPGSAGLRRFLGERLPGHMVPSVFVALPGLPRTPNGKVDRKALPAPDPRRSASSRFVPPRTPREERLAALWAEALGAEAVGIEDSFFELGGHSLLATRLLWRVREETGAERSLRDLLEHPTVAAFAASLATEEAGRPALPPLCRVPRDRPLPLSPNQLRLWLVEEQESGGVTYNVPVTALFDGPLDVAALGWSLGEIVRRHEALRTAFAVLGGEAVQVIRPAEPVPLPVIDLGDLPPEALEAEAGRLAHEEARRPFDLERGPVLRLALLRLGAAEHRLLLTVHHITWDDGSASVFLRELRVLYPAALARTPALLPEPDVQVADLAVWQRAWTRGEAAEPLLAWWRERLAGLPLLLELPADRPRPARRTDRGGLRRRVLPEAISAAVRELAHRQRSTSYMVLLTAFAALLGRITGRDRFALGGLVAARTRPETEGMIGFLTNTVLLPMDLAGEPRLIDLLAAARETVLGAMEHQDLPFDQVLEALPAASRAERRTPTRVLYTYYQAPAQGVELAPGLTFGWREEDNGRSKVDLTLFVEERDATFALAAEYSADLFDPSTVDHRLAELETLLAGALDSPERGVADLPLLTAAERDQLAAWSHTRREYPREAGLWDLFAAVAARSPEAVALEFDGEEVSYAELAERADGLARRLRASGVGAETPVALCCRRSPGLVAGMLGILKAGGFYVPLDPSHPRERQLWAVRDSGAVALVTQGEVVEGLPEEVRGAVPAVVLESPHFPASPSPASVPPPDLTPDPSPISHPSNRERGAPSRPSRARADRLPPLPGVGWEMGEGDRGGEVGRGKAPEADKLTPLGAGGDALAYVIYTSGSTGRPKGVAVPQRAVARLVLGTDYVELGPELRMGQVSNAAFDAITYEIWGALLHGGRLVGIERDATLDPRLLATALREKRIGSTFLTAALFQQVAREQPEAFAGMDQLLVGGDAVDPEAARAVLEAGPPRRLINGYGPTESTTFAVCGPIADIPAGARSVPIGRPIANTTAWVLDRSLYPLPVGVPGELCLGGDGLARGYLGRPDLTAERFVPDPVSGEPGARLYRTGDLVRWRPDGAIDFLGRVDHQVKIRGFRIEPGEIEAVLSAHPRVQEAAVIPVEAAPGDRRLAAFVVGRGGESLSAPDLRLFLKERLPEFMIPAVFVPLDALPLNPNGKVDRRALAAGAALRVEGGRERDRRVRPRGPVEEILASIWEEVLGVTRVGARDDFFDLGGHSLLVVRVLSRVRETLGADLPPRAVFEARTVAALAARIAAQGMAGPDAPPLVALPRPDPLPLSSAQSRLWFLERLGAAPGLYNIPVVYRIEGDLDPGALARAVRGLVDRHEALRTVFAEVEGEPVQVILPAVDVPLPILDLRGAGDLERPEREALRLFHQDAHRGFDLATGPVLRARLARTGEESWLLLLNIHHIAADGWSMRVLADDLTALYAAARTGGAPDLPGLPVQYADFALWQRQWLQGEVLDRQLGYWREQLAGLEPLELPTDRPRPAVPAFRGETRRRMLPPAVRERLLDLGRTTGATPFMIFLGAWAALLSRWSGCDDIAVGTPVANRNRLETERLIGFFVNTLALRLHLEGLPSFAGLLQRVRETTLEAYAHEDLPFDRLVEELRPERRASHTPLVQVLFTFHAEDAIPVPRLAGARVEAVEIDEEIAKFDLILGIEDGSRGLEATLEHAVALFDRATIDRMLAQYERLLAGALDDPGRPVAELPLLSDAERAQLFAEWNDTRTEYPADACLHELFAHAAERFPDRVALEFGETAMTYAELARQAGRLARCLRSLGVGPDVPVALFLERSAELIVALLATLQAGGACLPIDSEYPRERVAYLVQDAGARVLLTRSGLAERLPETDGAVRVVELDTEELPADGALPPAPVLPDHVAVLFYTSGSTGRPKGVMTTHRGAVRLVMETNYVRLGPDDRLGHISNISFDAATFEIWGALLYGGRLVWIPRKDLLSPERLEEAIRATGITATFITAALFHQVVAVRPAAFRTMRTLLVGGEPPDALLLRTVLEAGSPERLLNGYGPTECTTFAATWPIESVPEGATGVPIGRPIANTTAWVVDRRGQPVPAGVAGELWLGGPGLARGYLGRPGLTAERFVPDPFSEGSGARLYRTGDVVRRRADGAIEYLGRTDQQLKIRGFRIEPGEIEHVLEEHPAVQKAVVVPYEPARGEKRLAAYVVGPEGELPDPEVLRENLKSRLPEFMVPTAFVPLAALPLNANGKVDRRRLPRPERSHGRTWTEPRTDGERAVAAVWRDLLGVERVGLDDNFFDLGGHSLLLTRVEARLREVFARDVSLIDLFQYPDVRSLARFLEEGGAGDGNATGEARTDKMRRGRDRLRERGLKRRKETREA
jgi:amino acid adenylation domain-containing protein